MQDFRKKKTKTNFTSDKEVSSKFNNIPEEECLVARCAAKQIGPQEQFICHIEAGVSVGPVNTENTSGNGMYFRWRQNIINAKVFLTVVGNDQCEPPRDLQSTAAGRGGGGRGGGGGGDTGQRAGSAMPIWIFLLREQVCFCVTQRVGKPQFSTLMCHERCTGVWRHSGEPERK